MKKRSLMYKSLTQFITCVGVLLLLATPLFYWLTKSFYAEDMIDIIEAVQRGESVPTLDLEEDILHGVMIQFALIVTVLSIAIVLMIRFISKRLWLPFDKTLQIIESFKLENGAVLVLPESDIEEFVRLNAVLNKLMIGNLNTYRAQKEFTENASHELQTPLAVFQSKLDILLQQPELTEKQAIIIQDLYQMNNRLSHLSRSLLLLAKMENRQFSTEQTGVVVVLNGLSHYFESLSNGLKLQTDFQTESLLINANRSLLESMVNNLVVNAVRHNKQDGMIILKLKANSLMILNTSDETALDDRLIFNRFYRPVEQIKGNGLGLSIVKAVCEYHGWNITYAYRNGLHSFTVTFQ